jgi:hypothetical protein
VPLSVGSPRLGVTKHLALWSSDFPRSVETNRGRPAYSSLIIADEGARGARKKNTPKHAWGWHALRIEECGLFVFVDGAGFDERFQRCHDEGFGYAAFLALPEFGPVLLGA